MNDFFLDKKEKKKYLVNCLTNETDPQVKYSLFLVTCYFNAKSATSIIEPLIKRVKISSISLLIDKHEAIKNLEILVDLQKKNQSIFYDFRVWIVDGKTLFHPKLYSLICFSQNGEVTSGNLVFTSANLTNQGLIKNYGNVEFISATSNINTLVQFYDKLTSLTLMGLKQLERQAKNYQKTVDYDIFRDFYSAKDKNIEESQEQDLESVYEDYFFKYRLLCCGFFLSKWTDDLNESLLLRYELSTDVKNKDAEDELKAKGFEVKKSASISKQYFDLKDEKENDILEANETKNRMSHYYRYGVSTFLGYWIPQQFSIGLVERIKKYDRFAESLKKILINQLENACKVALEDYEYLCENRLIEKKNKDIKELLRQKVDRLLENEIKLKRIWGKYYVFEMPYNFQDYRQVNTLYDILLDTCNKTDKKNKSIHAVLKADKNKTLSPILEIDPRAEAE